MISSSIGKVTTAHQKIRPIAAVPLTKRSNIAKSDSYPAKLTVKGAKKTNASKNVVTVPTGVSDSLSKDSAQISDPHSAVGLTEFEEFASVESTDKEDSRCHQKRLTSMNAWTIWAL